LNTIGSQILSIKAISYLLNLPNHITNYDFTYILWYSLSTWVNEQEIKDNNQNENTDITTNNFETFTIHKTFENSKYIIHNFQTNYQQRPKVFEFFSLYEFSSKTYKINNIYNHRFHHDHLQHNTHGVNEYKITKILVLQSYTIPLRKNDPKSYV
jgi:hypothetical protein